MAKEFDQKALTEYDGRDGAPVYIARDGAVYDVSESLLWSNGEHMQQHRAGRDLSESFSRAPHGPEVFERFPRVGTLQEKEIAVPEEKPQRPHWLAGLLGRHPILQRHPHPALVHFPIAFMFAVPLFSLLALLSGKASFETTAFHCLGLALLMTPLTIGSGFFTWWLNYRARPIKPVKIKIAGSALLMLLILVLFLWRYHVPELVFSSGGLRLLYLFLILSLFPLVSVIGWYGATLTFPVDQK